MAAVAAPVAAALDLRIVIDVSGSMRADAGLRVTALEHLVAALPDDAHAGVWTFGRQVNMLVPHGRVDAQWHIAARGAAVALQPVALRTHLRAALEAAAWDVDAARESRRDVVLISDGRVDIADDAAVNDAERRALIAELPRLAKRGFVVHSLAVSTNADALFLAQFAAATGGYAIAAGTVAEIDDFVARVLAPSTSATGSFVVGQDVAELTLLAAYPPGTNAHLVTPSQQRIDASLVSGQIHWRSLADGRALVTLAAPAAGRWRFEPTPQHLLLFDDLALKIRPVMVDDTLAAFEAYLTQSERMIDDAWVKDLVHFSAERRSADAATTLRLRTDGSALTTVELPADGFGPGDKLLVRAQGPTFERAAEFALSPDAAFECTLTPGPANDARMELHLAQAGLDLSAIRIMAALSLPTGRTKLVTGVPIAPGRWAVPVPGFGPDIEVMVKISGNLLNKKDFAVTLDPFSLALPLPEPRRLAFDAGGVLIEPAATAAQISAGAEVAADLPEPGRVQQSDPSAAQTEPAAVADALVPVAVAPRPLTRWDALGFGTLGGLNLLALLWLLYRAIVAGRQRLAEPQQDDEGARSVSPLGAALASYRSALTQAQATLGSGAN
jgi:hypothetical protein